MNDLPLFDTAAADLKSAIPHLIVDNYLPDIAEPDALQLAFRKAAFLRHLTGLNRGHALWPDPYDYQAGLLENDNGEAVACHALSTKHPDTKLYKSLILYYVLEDSDSALLLKNKRGEVARIPLKKNRLIIFENRPGTYVGFSGGEQSRRLLSTVYYSDQKPGVVSTLPRWARDRQGPVSSTMTRRRVVWARLLWFFSDRLAMLAARVDA